MLVVTSLDWRMRQGLVDAPVGGGVLGEIVGDCRIASQQGTASSAVNVALDDEERQSRGVGGGVVRASEQTHAVEHLARPRALLGDDALDAVVEARLRHEAVAEAHLHRVETGGDRLLLARREELRALGGELVVVGALGLVVLVEQALERRDLHLGGLEHLLEELAEQRVCVHLARHGGDGVVAADTQIAQIARRERQLVAVDVAARLERADDGTEARLELQHLCHGALQLVRQRRALVRLERRRGALAQPAAANAHGTVSHDGLAQKERRHRATSLDEAAASSAGDCRWHAGRQQRRRRRRRQGGGGGRGTVSERLKDQLAIGALRRGGGHLVGDARQVGDGVEVAAGGLAHGAQEQRVRLAKVAHVEVDGAALVGDVEHAGAHAVDQLALVAREAVRVRHGKVRQQRVVGRRRYVLGLAVAAVVHGLLAVGQEPHADRGARGAQRAHALAHVAQRRVDVGAALGAEDALVGHARDGGRDRALVVQLAALGVGEHGGREADHVPQLVAPHDHRGRAAAPQRRHHERRNQSARLLDARRRVVGRARRHVHALVVVVHRRRDVEVEQHVLVGLGRCAVSAAADARLPRRLLLLARVRVDRAEHVHVREAARHHEQCLRIGRPQLMARHGRRGRERARCRRRRRQ